MSKIKVILFWLISCTWGAIMTSIGAVVALVLICTGYRPHRFHHLIYFEVGYGWGGVELGAFFVVSRGASLHTKKHEAGHAIQNIILGVFMPFVVCIPSAVRYWWREWVKHRGRGATLPPYDSIWFEGWASRLGKKYFN